MTDEKVCTHCGVPKPVPDGFYRTPGYNPGTWRLRSWCRSCCNRDTVERNRTPLGRLRSRLASCRFQLRTAIREQTRARLAARIARLETEIETMTEVGS